MEKSFGKYVLKEILCKSPSIKICKINSVNMFHLCLPYHIWHAYPLTQHVKRVSISTKTSLC